MAWLQTDKFAFACDSRHRVSSLNVTLEPWLSWALRRAYPSQREGVKSTKGSGKSRTISNHHSSLFLSFSSPSKDCLFLVVMTGIIVIALIGWSFCNLRAPPDRSSSLWWSWDLKFSWVVSKPVCFSVTPNCHSLRLVATLCCVLTRKFPSMGNARSTHGSVYWNSEQCALFWYSVLRYSWVKTSGRKFWSTWPVPNRTVHKS